MTIEERAVTQNIEERLADEAKRLREMAGMLPPGGNRDELLEKARQVETALHVLQWLNSPGIVPRE